MREFETWVGQPVVIDSSVAFKWFATDEPGAEQALALLRRHEGQEVALVAPAHLPLEVVNALAVRRRRLQDVEDAIGFLTKAHLLVAPVDDALLVESVRIAASERIALHDAAFIALAARLDTVLVTADRRQASTKACKVQLVH